MLPQLIAQARITNPVAPSQLNPQTETLALYRFGDLITLFINIAIIAAAVIFFFFFVIGGIKWITSGGEKTKVESARGTLTSAVVGLVAVFAVFAVMRLIENLFGIDLLQINLGRLKITSSP